MDKLLEASEAAAKGDWRKAADSYWKAYQLASKEWAYNAISGYTSVLLEGHFKAAPTDLDRLRDLSKDIGASPLLQVAVATLPTACSALYVIVAPATAGSAAQPQ